MIYTLALSAENVSKSLADQFPAVGMIRGEYVFRYLKKYITIRECQIYLRNYLEHVCKTFYPKPVWYRTSELDVEEVSILKGSDNDNIQDWMPNLGTRGIRRAQLHPDTYLIELRILGDLARKYSNLGMILPFVTTYDEVLWAIELIKKEKIKIPVASMAEIPAFILEIEKILELDISRIVIGLNDLSSLTQGADRRSKRFPKVTTAIKKLLQIAQRATQNSGIQLAVAGYHTEQSINAIRELEIEECVLHYCQLPEFLGDSYGSLPYLNRVRDIKKWTQLEIQKRKLQEKFIIS